MQRITFIIPLNLRVSLISLEAKATIYRIRRLGVLCVILVFPALRKKNNNVSLLTNKY